MLKHILKLGICLSPLIAIAQNQAIPVTDTSIILDYDQTQELFFSFAEGDEVVIDLKMVKGKNLKEVEMVEMPNNALFSEFKVSNLQNKKVYIRTKGIYKFRFYSSSLTRRVCRINISRIPSSNATRSFNTNWRWDIKRDTVYTSYTEDSLVGYKKIKYQEVVRELKEKKQEEVMLINKSQKVHSYYNENRSRDYLRVDLPQIQNSHLYKERIIAWSYWIGVDNEGHEAYKKSVKLVAGMVKDISSLYTTPLGGLAIGAISELIIPQQGEDVEYYFIEDFQNVQQFLNRQQFYLFDSGKGRGAYGRNDTQTEGTFYIGLANDNKLKGIEVEVKVLAVKEVQRFEDVLYNREREEPQYITLNKTKMNVYESQIRVPVE